MTRTLRVICLLLIFMSPMSAGAFEFNAIDLGTLGGNVSTIAPLVQRTFGPVNAVGQVVGWSNLPGDAVEHAFSWTAAGGMIDLGALAGTDGSRAFFVSNNGTVVGNSYLAPFTHRGQGAVFLWSRAEGMVEVPIPDPTTADGSLVPPDRAGRIVAGLSDDGTVFVIADAFNGFFQRSWAWSQADGLIDLGVVTVIAVSRDGHALLRGRPNDQFPNGQSFLWSRTAGFVDVSSALVSLGPTSSSIFPELVADGGMVVGSVRDATTTLLHGFSWTPSGGVVELETFGDDARPMNVSSDGRFIVGGSNVQHRLEQVLWTADNGVFPIMLDIFVDTMQDEAAVSVRGDVFGYYVDGFGGHGRYLWNPIDFTVPLTIDNFTPRGVSDGGLLYGQTLNGHAAVVRLPDGTAPVLTVPSTISASPASPAGAVVEFLVTARDDTDPNPTVSCFPASGSMFPIGRTTVSCTATDARGNHASASFAVVVGDSTPPILRLPNLVTVEATGPFGTVVTFATAATDDQDANPTVRCSPQSGSTFGLGTWKVSCDAADASGNRAFGSFYVVVRDTAPPTLTVPASMTLEATSRFGAVVTFSVTATDTVDPSPSFGCSPTSSGMTLPIGTYTITCWASDRSRNSSQKSFGVTVRDTTPPVVTGPSDMTVDATNPNAGFVSFTVTARDVADPNPTVVCVPSSGYFLIGKTLVSCSVFDASRNVTSWNFSVTVRGATEQIATLSTTIAQSGLPQGTATSLSSKLPASSESGPARCNKLVAFGNEVRAQTGKKLSYDQVTALINSANRIRNVAGCP